MGLVGGVVGQGVGTICHQFRERLIAGQGGLVQSVKRNHECPRSPAVDGSQQRQLSYLLRSKAKGNRCQVIGGLAFSHRAMIADSSIHCQYQCIDTSIHICYNSCMTAKGRVTMTTITYNEIDDYYEVMTRATEQRYPTRQQAAIAANEAGDTVYLVNFDPEGLAWMQKTLNILAQFRTDRAAIPARPRRKRMTQAQRRWQEGAR